MSLTRAAPLARGPELQISRQQRDHQHHPEHNISAVALEFPHREKVEHHLFESQKLKTAGRIIDKRFSGFKSWGKTQSLVTLLHISSTVIQRLQVSLKHQCTHRLTRPRPLRDVAAPLNRYKGVNSTTYCTEQYNQYNPFQKNSIALKTVNMCCILNLFC